MEVTVVQQEGLKKVLTVSVPAELVDAELKQQYRQYANNARIPGFRPGKVPEAHIVKQFGRQIGNEVAARLMQNTIANAVEKSALNCAGIENMEGKTVNKGQPFVYTATVEEYPQFTVVDLSGVELNKDESTITDADIDKMLENLRKQKAEWTTVTRPAALKDKVVIDFEGVKNGERVDNACAKGFELELGSNSMIPGFEDAVVGMKATETKTVDITFPADYFEATLAGQVLSFTFTCHEVKEASLPELNDEFAAQFGLKTNSVEGLRAELVKSMQRELRDRLRAKNKTMVLDKLVELNKIELPSVLVRQEIDRLKKELFAQFKLPKDQFDKLPIQDAMFKDRAERSVRLSLVLMEYIKANDIKADPAKVKEYIDHIAETYEEKDEVVDYYTHNKERMHQIEMVVIEDTAVEMLQKSAKLTVVNHSYEDVMMQDQRAR